MEKTRKICIIMRGMKDMVQANWVTSACNTLSPVLPCPHFSLSSPSHPPSPPPQKKAEPKKGIQNIVYYKPGTPMDFASGDKL